jgi:hypothetical protein
MSFSNDPQFIDVLHRYVTPHEIDTIIETGTYLGLGSTRMLAEFFCHTRSPKCFLTFEVNWVHFQHAKINLRPFGFVDCRWGASLPRSTALEFIRNDEAIRDHSAYPDIWIDNVDDPVAFYSHEIMGSMPGQRSALPGYRFAKRLADFYSIGSNSFLWDGEQLLPQACTLHKWHKPLIVLDSAGGVGYLEFLTVLELMQNAEYLLLLDDVHHLKHFRSLQRIQRNPLFKVLALNQRHGWVLAHHFGSHAPAAG